MAAKARNGQDSDQDLSRADLSFDGLAKGLAQGTLSRRKALRLVGGALLGGVMASIPRVAWAANGGNSACAKFCKERFPPGRERGQCISAAAHGEGPCFDGNGGGTGCTSVGGSCPGGFCTYLGGVFGEQGIVVCCPFERECEEGGAGRCCPEGDTCTDFGCCPPERVCSTSTFGPNSCCPAEGTCVNGECVCPPGTTVAGRIPARLQCCPFEKVCGADCCTPDEFCSEFDLTCTPLR